LVDEQLLGSGAGIELNRQSEESKERGGTEQNHPNQVNDRSCNAKPATKSHGAIFDESCTIGTM
jgi:hypothetical protein